MKRLTRRFNKSRRAACTLALLFAFAAAASAQEERPAQARKEKGSSTARGRVVYADTDEPVRRARVLLMRLEILVGGSSAGPYSDGGIRTTATDSRGEFSFTKLAAGRYVVNVAAPDVISFGGGEARAAAPFDIFGYADNVDERVFDLDGTNGAEKTVRVRRGGALSGRVFYSDGDAATNATVHLFCRDSERWAKCRNGAATVDDRGQYRFEGLPPGEYLVGVAENNIWSARSRKHSLGATIFFAAYHPSATSPRKAEAVRVEAGRETEDADVTLGEGLRRISGGAKWRRDGQPVKDAIVRLQSLEDAVGGTTHIFPLGAYALARAVAAQPAANDITESTDEQGRWSFENLPDGKYLLTIMAVLEEKMKTESVGERGASHRRMPTVVQRSQEVVVSGGDVTGLSFQLTEGGRVSGVVTFEGVAQAPAPPVYVLANHKSAAGHAQPVAGITKEDGTFEIGGLADGEVVLSTVPLSGDKFYVKSISGPDGADLTRTPLRVGEEAHVGGVRVVIASDVATLAGRVVGRDGRVHVGSRVFLMTADQSPWGVADRQCSSLVGVEGNFTMNCPPGDYLLFVTRAGDASHRTRAVTDGAARAPSLRITLRPNERKEVEVAAPEAQ